MDGAGTGRSLLVLQNWLLVDCGSIYVNGVNGGSEIAHNYCLNQTQLFGALYPDEGSSLWNIHDNVVENAVEWLHIWTGSINRITVCRVRVFSHGRWWPASEVWRVSVCNAVRVLLLAGH